MVPKDKKLYSFEYVQSCYWWNGDTHMKKSTCVVRNFLMGGGGWYPHMMQYWVNNYIQWKLCFTTTEFSDHPSFATDFSRKESFTL